jgi:hypothetical protein
MGGAVGTQSIAVENTTHCKKNPEVGTKRAKK